MGWVFFWRLWCVLYKWPLERRAEVAERQVANHAWEVKEAALNAQGDLVHVAEERAEKAEKNANRALCLAYGHVWDDDRYTSCERCWIAQDELFEETCKQRTGHK